MSIVKTAGRAASLFSVNSLGLPKEETVSKSDHSVSVRYRIIGSPGHNWQDNKIRDVLIRLSPSHDEQYPVRVTSYVDGIKECSVLCKQNAIQRTMAYVSPIEWTKDTDPEPEPNPEDELQIVA